MTQPDLDSQTPPAKILLPLGAALIILPILCLTLWNFGLIPNIMLIVLVVMGVGIAWQGTKNLKRGKT